MNLTDQQKENFDERLIQASLASKTMIYHQKYFDDRYTDFKQNKNRFR